MTAVSARGRNLHDIATADKPPHRVISTHTQTQTQQQQQCYFWCADGCCYSCSYQHVVIIACCRKETREEWEKKKMEIKRKKKLQSVGVELMMTGDVVVTTATTILFNGMFYGRSEWAANEKLWSEVATASDHKGISSLPFSMSTQLWSGPAGDSTAIFCQRK